MNIPQLTLTIASIAFGRSKETVKRALARAGISHVEGATYSIQTIHDALAGDTRAERARLLSEQADKTSLENRKARGELVSISEMRRRLWEAIYLPTKQAFEHMDEELSPLLSPDDPNRTKAILRQWIEDFKKNCLKPIEDDHEKQNETEK
jgi:hypothetical protein